MIPKICLYLLPPFMSTSLGASPASAMSSSPKKTCQSQAHTRDMQVDSRSWFLKPNTSIKNVKLEIAMPREMR